MPKGFHCGHITKRSYIGQYHRIYARSFKQLLDAEPANYILRVPELDEQHQIFKLIEHDEKWPRVMLFTINDQQIPVPLQLDNSSASNKLYLICPYCINQRQYLLATKKTYCCRECLNVHYASQSESKIDRLARRIRKQRRKLWSNDHIFINDLFESSGYFPKPKGFHFTTFIKKQFELINLETEYWQLAGKQLGIILNDLDELNRALTG